MTTRHPLLCTLESEKANKIKLEKCIKSQKKSDTLIMGGESRLGGSEKILNEIQAFYRPSTYIKKSWCGNTRTLKALQALCQVVNIVALWDYVVKGQVQRECQGERPGVSGVIGEVPMATQRRTQRKPAWACWETRSLAGFFVARRDVKKGESE